MTYIPGIDVSHWQGTINWEAVKAAGKEFSYIKATDGNSFVDRQFTANWQGAKEAGLLRGAYHFFRPLQDVMSQVDIFTKTVTLEEGDLPPVLDMEVSNNLKNTTIIPRVEAWLEAIEKRTGIKPIIYSGVSFMNYSFTTSPGKPPDWATNYLLWIANYLKLSATRPNLPTGWSKWSFWQYSASGWVNGVAGAVDLDWFNGSLDELQLLAGLQNPPVTPPVTPPSPPPPSPVRQRPGPPWQGPIS